MKHTENRRKGAFKRLQDQLESGSKTEKKSTGKIPLTDKDKERIGSEIKTLKNRVNVI